MILLQPWDTMGQQLLQYHDDDDRNIQMFNSSQQQGSYDDSADYYGGQQQQQQQQQEWGAYDSAHNVKAEPAPAFFGGVDQGQQFVPNNSAIDDLLNNL